MKSKLYRIFVLCAIFIIAGCAQVAHYSPESSNRHYSLSNFSTEKTEVNVSDFRAAQSGDDICNIVKRQIIASLSGKNTLNNYIINVQVLDHKSYFTLGNWNAETQFRVKVYLPDGKDIALFDAGGRASLSNMLGYSTAKEVSQNAYNLAIADLMSKLSLIKTN